VTLRGRLTLVATGVVAAVVVAASFATYFLMRHELYSGVDGTLSAYAFRLQHDPTNIFRGPGEFGNDYAEVVSPDGTPAPGGYSLPVDKAIVNVAAGNTDGFFRNVTIAHLPFREVVAPLRPPNQGAAIVIQEISSLKHTQNRLRLILFLVSIGGILAAALAGALVSRATLAPVRRLTAAAERITETGDPSERVPESGRGELRRLASSFNTMLGALEESIEAQRRFVADASHELRTPLTSL